jgi:hypothetical protein
MDFGQRGSGRIVVRIGYHVKNGHHSFYQVSSFATTIHINVVFDIHHGLLVVGEPES